MIFKFMVLLLGFAIMLFTFSTNISLGQLLPFGLENTATNIKAVNITSPINHQQVPIGKDLMISGTSIANATSNCQIIVGINNIKPYPRAIGIGPGGAKDYSKWSLTLASNYSAIKQGPDNKITARYKCSSSNNINPTIIPVNSINVTGVPVTNTNNTIINQSPQQQRPSSTPENNITTTTSSTPTIIPGLLH